MRKYYYVCPRCGRCYKRYIPRRKVKCGFCSTVWKTRKAKGTRSAFSWTATLTTLVALAALVFFVGRELGVFPKTPILVEDVEVESSRSWETELAPSLSAESVENDGTTDDAESVETLENAENSDAAFDVENADNAESTSEAEDAAAE